MTPATIIREAQADGVRLALSPAGTITAIGDGAAVNRWLAVIRERKAEILAELQREMRRQKAIALMEAAPGTQRGVYVDDQSDPQFVVLAVAVRACNQTCEMTISKNRYDPWRLLELIERHGAPTH